jgi:hypothetical protein
MAKVTVTGEVKKAFSGNLKEMGYHIFGGPPPKRTKKRPLYVVPAFDNRRRKR